MIPKPSLPFKNYKWRWASVAPTEGLNNPEVFIGVLRALSKAEGLKPNDESLLADLEKVQEETETNVDLVRTPERNLVRNSGQYWKAVGLLAASQPSIELTPLGKALCDGGITASEFAALTVSTLTLPNPAIQSTSEVKAWGNAGIQFKPLFLILNTIGELAKSPYQGYITKNELIRILEPLSATTIDPRTHADAVLAHRNGTLNIDTWPNCATSANDHRMANEFLLFLKFHHYLKEKTAHNGESKFWLGDVTIGDVAIIESVAKKGKSVADAVANIQHSNVLMLVERERILREVLNRPGQAKFREKVFDVAKGQCLFSETKVQTVLEAAHIIPVAKNGSDDASNGFCMRVDFHMLFDSGHIRIAPNGDIATSSLLQTDAIYKQIPKRISIPPYVNPAHLAWRWNYN